MTALTERDSSQFVRSLSLGSIFILQTEIGLIAIPSFRKSRFVPGDRASPGLMQRMGSNWEFPDTPPKVSWDKLEILAISFF